MVTTTAFSGRLQLMRRRNSSLFLEGLFVKLPTSLSERISRDVTQTITRPAHVAQNAITSSVASLL